MLILVTLWWMLFWTSVGLCIGSFLNAVIYRLPRDCSLRDPLWSYCPACRHRILWYDNLPVLSFILLRGRCRHCGVPISTRYPVIEMSMALIVLMLMDAFFVGHVRGGLNPSAFGLTDRLSTDWPIFVAHIVLFACLLSMSTIDLEHYWVDIRFTNIATLVGFACHALWTPGHATEWVRPGDTTAIVSVFAVIGLVVAWLFVLCRPTVEKLIAEPTEEAALDQPPVEPEVPKGRKPPPSLVSGPRAAGWIVGVLFLGTWMALFLDESHLAHLRHTGRGMLPLLMFFVLIVWESTRFRTADDEIAEAIQSERHTARRMVMVELTSLLPAIVAGGIGIWLMSLHNDIPAELARGLHATVRIDSVTMMRQWSPIFGFATAASGYIIAGAVGWAVRIFFTLLFGKEAFGTGDIHLMAAAGAVMGWPQVVVGFFITCLIAVVGWIATLPFKHSRALPLGPWLSLSLLAVALFYDAIIKFPFIARFLNALQTLIFHA